MNRDHIDMPAWPVPTIGDGEVENLMLLAKGKVAARKRKRRNIAVAATTVCICTAGFFTVRTMFLGNGGNGDLRAMLEADLTAHNSSAMFAFDSGPIHQNLEVYDGI